MRLLAFWTSHREELAAMVERHLFLVLWSTIIATAIGLPAGILAAHRPRIGRPLLAAASIAQTIPSLALLGFLLPLPFIGGIGPRIAIVALILYALLPIVRSTAAGLRSIDPSVIDAGVAMGMTSRQLLWLVELPLALPSIVAGIRIATIVGIGTATIAAAIGAGGLGEYIFRGLSMVDSTVILAGAIPAAVLALLADGVLTWVERLLAPGRRRRSAAMPIAVATSAVLLAAVASAAGLGPARPNTIVVGSKNFTEQVVLGELLAQTLERRGINVTRRLNLGGSFICDRAIRSGDIDAYIEYTGTALAAILKQPVEKNPDTALISLRNAYGRSGLSVLAPLGFNNTFAMLVRRTDADTLGLATIDDLRRVETRWRPGFGYEFAERADGYAGLLKAYELRFATPPRVMELNLVYRALATRQVDVIAGDATSGLIKALDLTMLRDNRIYFPPYYAVPIVRSAVLLAHPELREALNDLAGRISEDDMRTMNASVDVEHRDVAATVKDFLRVRLPN
jgi:osmoprotectant transport system substrate-binding protein/osmoprotectant transport system permease protein